MDARRGEQHARRRPDAVSGELGVREGVQRGVGGGGRAPPGGRAPAPGRLFGMDDFLSPNLFSCRLIRLRRLRRNESLLWMSKSLANVQRKFKIVDITAIFILRFKDMFKDRGNFKHFIYFFN